MDGQRPNSVKENIASHGIKEPIKYFEFNGTKYVVDGHHRLMAARELGLKSVPAESVNLPYKGYRNVLDLFE